MWTSVVMGGKWVLSPFYIYALYKRRCLSSVIGNTFSQGTVEVTEQRFPPFFSPFCCHLVTHLCYSDICLSFQQAVRLFFLLQANVCEWSHRGPWQKELQLCLRALLWLPLSCLDSEVKQRIWVGVMKRGIMCGLRFYSPPCNNQSVNSPYPGIILRCTMLIQKKQQTPRLLLLMIPRTTLVCGDKMITFFQAASSLCLSLWLSFTGATPLAMCLLTDPEALSAATGVSPPTEREGQPSGSRSCLMLDSP